MKSEKEIVKLITPFLGGDDPIFGTRCTLNLVDLFSKKKMEYLRKEHGADMTVLYGIGSGLFDWDCPLVYLDVPKNEI